jgi:protein ImuA
MDIQLFVDISPVVGTRSPESLHPALWLASQLGRAATAGRATGFAALDAELPGGGWPPQALTELLLPHPGVGELRLLAPALAALQQGTSGLPRSVMLFDPPAQPCAWAWSALGLDVRQLVIVRGRDGLQGRARTLLPAADTLWALEQALASGQVGAVLAWLPTRLRGDSLRRLQLAAQSHPGPAFLLRDIEARLKPSAAPLRLQLATGAPDQLRLRFLKRRGPPCAEALLLSLPPVLGTSARERASTVRQRPQPATLAVHA